MHSTQLKQNNIMINGYAAFFSGWYSMKGWGQVSHIQPPRTKQSKIIYCTMYTLFSWTPVERLLIEMFYQTHFMETVRNIITTSDGMFRSRLSIPFWNRFHTIDIYV